MPLVSLKEVLDWAEAHNAAVPAFNIDNIDIAQSLMLAAEEEQKPVILAVGQGAIRVGRLDLLASVVKRWPQDPLCQLFCTWTTAPALSKPLPASGLGLPLSCSTGLRFRCGKILSRLDWLSRLPTQ